MMKLTKATIAKLGSDISTQDARGKGRLRLELLESSLGEVIDMSASGMRVEHKGKMTLPKAAIERNVPIELTLKALTGNLKVRAKVVRIKKLGFRRHEIGLTFVDVTEEIAEALTRLVRISVDGRMIYDGRRAGGQ